MDLFIHPTELETLSDDPAWSKTAGEVHLPEDPNEWPKEILDELFKQVPYIADFRPHVVMQKADAERGYGFGHVEISNESEAQMGTPPQQLEAAGIRSVRIPIIIRDGKMSPFDLLVNDAGVLMPLTETRLRQAIFRPQLFDITSKTPGDQSMIGQLYPPYRQNYGFGGGGVSVPADGMGKAGSALSHEEELIRILEGDDKGFRKVKVAAELDQAAREHIKPKNFAIPKGDGPGDTGKYPIHDEEHARNALTRVDQYGTPQEKSQVYAAVAKKYPGLARRSSVPEVAEKAKKKESSVILPSIAHTINSHDLDNFWSTVQGDPSIQAAFRKNAEATSEALGVLANLEPKSLEKQASALPYYIKPTVVQISKNHDGYIVKSASHKFWRIYDAHIDRGELVRQYGEKVAMAVDTSGAVTLAEDATEASVEKRAEVEPVTHPGLYKVFSQDGKEIIGFVIPNLLDVDGQALPLSLFTNGTQTTVQAEIFGEPAGEGTSLPIGPVSGHGAFFEVGEDGVLKATIPMELAGSAEADGITTMHGQTFDGRPVEVSVQPNIAEPTGTPEGKLLIPQHWKWTPMDNAQEVALAGGDEDPEAGAAKSEMGMADTEPPPAGGASEPKPMAAEVEKKSWVELRGSNETFSLSGPAVHKLASTDRAFLDIDDAMFLLAGLGVEQGHGASKLAEAMTGSYPVKVITSRELALAEDVEKWAAARARELYDSLPQLKRVLIKEAASMPDPAAVDTVLSLGFINPENIMSFVGHIPELDENQMKLCNLLFAARLGMPNVSAGALERAVRAIEEVIEGLKVIAFQG